MKNILHILILIMGILAISAPVSAEIYQYTDKKGNIVYSDNPPQGSDAKKKQLKDDGIFWSSPQDEPEPYRGGKSAAGSPVPESEKKRKRDYGDATVVMYMTDWCGYCKKAREYVRSLGAKLVEYNIDRDEGRKDEMRTKSGGSSGVPLIDIDGTIIRGYSPSAIKAALDRSASR
jgi:glutaredoxin